MAFAKHGGPVQPSTSVWRPLGTDEVEVTGGIWGQRQRLNADTILRHCETWMERVGWAGNFDRAAAGVIAGRHSGIEFVDSEVYKLLEAMAWELGRGDRADDLQARYSALAARVAAAQEPDGYLHTSFGRPGQPARYSDLESGHELYCFGHLFQAAVARLRTGHDDLLPQVARRLADHVYDQFGPGGRAAVCGHPEIEMALAELARATGERRYLELASLLVERRGAGTLRSHPLGQEYFQDDVPVRAAATLRGHAVRALYLAAGAFDVATESGDDELAAAVRRQWANGVARRTYITGGIGSHHQGEAFGDDFELPADRAYAETCAGIASVMLSWRLLLATGEDKYADLIERTLLNNVLASPRADGRAFFYTNTLHQRSPGPVPDEDQVSPRAESGLRAPWFEVSCCPTNVARMLASIGLYFATASESGIQLHQYGDYRVSVALAAGRLTLQVTSVYPFGGPVSVKIIEAPAREVTLRLRVPGWAQGSAVLSEAPTTQTRGHAEIRRVFLAGDSVDIAFPAGARVTYPDPRIDAVRGTFAVERGPLVLVLESPDLPAGWSVNEVTADPGSIADDGDGTAIDVFRRMLDKEEWPYSPELQGREGERARARLIPYHQWANRGPGTMRAWLPLAGSRDRNEETRRGDRMEGPVAQHGRGEHG
ncbi:MAG TPA: beta-L-arabinofuranosidase domain-containing protein [Trebonia sp.]|nr:beta-L-arabinofuranosidase domain-containing protein [Trebonia sp.]